jgi:hypothetical protein
MVKMIALFDTPKDGRGAGGEGKTHTVRRFQLKLTPMDCNTVRLVILCPGRSPQPPDKLGGKNLFYPQFIGGRRRRSDLNQIVLQ